MSIFSETSLQDLCPFCDEVWPQNASEQLVARRQKLEAESHPELHTDSTNPFHLEHPRGPFVTVPFCQDHKFEYKILPMARANNWPTYIDFYSIYPRLERILPHVLHALKTPTTSPYYWLARGDYEKFSNVAMSTLGVKRDWHPNYGAG